MFPPNHTAYTLPSRSIPPSHTVPPFHTVVNNTQRFFIMNTLQQGYREPSPTSVTAALTRNSFKLKCPSPPLRRMEEFYSEDSCMEMEMEVEQDEQFETEIFNLIHELNRDESKRLLYNIWNAASEACGSDSCGWKDGKDPLTEVTSIITPQRLQTIDDPIKKKNLPKMRNLIAHAYDSVPLRDVHEKNVKDWDLTIPEWAYDVNI